MAMTAYAEASFGDGFTMKSHRTSLKFLGLKFMSQHSRVQGHATVSTTLAELNDICRCAERQCLNAVIRTNSDTKTHQQRFPLIHNVP